ncbi:MAG: hypothetical protein LBT33_05395, partial [Spirochaetia bacterium]|nr:hypothetical protein [Spirochaetia bacterium]
MQILRDFRYNPGRMGEQQFCLQNCDQPLARPGTHGRQTVLRYQHGASPTAKTTDGFKHGNCEICGASPYCGK